MVIPDGFTIRSGSIQDLALIVSHRRGMFSDMGYCDQSALDSMSSKFLPWLQAKMASGDYLAWFATAGDGTVAAGAGLWLMDWPPHMIGSSLRRGNIVNVFTAAPFRRQGLARCLVETAVQWCQENSIDTIILHASDEGRHLYESLGFTASNEMRIRK